MLSLQNTYNKTDLAKFLVRYIRGTPVLTHLAHQTTNTLSPLAERSSHPFIRLQVPQDSGDRRECGAGGMHGTQGPLTTTCVRPALSASNLLPPSILVHATLFLLSASMLPM
jgi:hypothetical protein